MAKNSCLAFPQVQGKNGTMENSKMYGDLLKIVKDRPQVNWIYSKYMASNAATLMDQQGYKRNSQGEFNAQDLLDFLHFADMQKDMTNLHLAELQLGAVDASNNRVDFTDARDALEKVDNFNDNHTGLVATVFQHGDVYNIHVFEKSARTHMYPTDVKERLAVWNIYRQAFNGINVDIENMPAELKSVFNANNMNIAQHLRNLQNMQFNYLYRKDALLLMSLDANSPQVQRAINAFGSIEAAAQAVDDINHGVGNYNQTQIRVAMNAISQAQKIQGLDLQALQTQTAQMSQNVKTSSPEEDIRATLHTLKKKYNIDINEIHLIGDEIKTLSQAAAEAALQIQRQIREIENKQGDMVEGKRLEGILSTLLKELNNKKYYSGMLSFLAEAQAVQADVDNMIVNTPQTGTELERAFQQAKTLQKIQSYKEQYYPVISALADEATIIDESINPTDIKNLRQTAKDLKEFFDKKEKVIRSLGEDTMTKLLMEIIGDKAPDGQSIVNIVKMAQTDSSIFDYLYSVGRASNPIIAAMGSIIRNAQDSRDTVMNDFSRRIRRATEKLNKAGFNSEFMYEDEEHLISDIDWAGYDAARKAQIKALARQGLKGFDFRMALQNWEEANTEDRVVDKKTGRTEKVPNSNYRKQFPQLSQAQLDYYNEMMDIKGEIGSYLPAYAQRQYLAPQLRRNMVDALGKAKNAQDVWKAFKNKGQNFYKIREDDTNYANKGSIKNVIDGEEYTEAVGDFDNTPLNKIPIFFVNKVEAGELLKDFSTGLQHLAGTAINYDAMSNIASVVEFMGDFAKNVHVKDVKNRADVVKNGMVSVVKDLYKKAKSDRTANIIEGFISKHLWGKTIDDSLGEGWTKMVLNIIGYTSFKGLATNFKGMVSNYLVGEFQMLIEAGAGEFYNLKDYGQAHLRLFGNAGVKGEIMELLTNNMNHKATLFRELFDPTNDSFSTKSHERYYPSMFRQLLSKDLSFLGYASGEYLIHYVNMYAILNHEKVKLNGKTISLYDAFEVTNKQDGNSELTLKQGVTRLDGSAITPEFLDDIRRKIRYCNQTCHGSMNSEDKGVIHQKLWGRAVMNFRQWAVEHYSRRFRGMHFDSTLRQYREGYWVSLWKAHAKEARDNKEKKWIVRNAHALELFARDLLRVTLRAEVQWPNLNTMQRNNVKRVAAEMHTFIALISLAFALGEPDEHKKEFWRRFFIYQTKRMKMEIESGMPWHPKATLSIINMLQSPMAGIDTFNAFMYTFTGLANGDFLKEIKSGPHKGENRYWRTWSRYNLPFIKDIEQMQAFDKDDTLFQIFSDTPSRH